MGKQRRSYQEDQFRLAGEGKQARKVTDEVRRNLLFRRVPQQYVQHGFGELEFKKFVTKQRAEAVNRTKREVA